MKNIFTIGEVIDKAVEITKKHFWMLVGLGLAYFAVTVAMEVVYYMPNIIHAVLNGFNLEAEMNVPMVIFNVAWSLPVYFLTLWFGYVMMVNLYKINFRIFDGGDFKIADLFNKVEFSQVLRFFGINFILGMIVFVGLICLIIPGIYFGIRFGFAPYILIDKDDTIGDALDASWKITEGQVWNIFVLGLVSFVIVLAGLIALLVGVIPAFMIVSFAGIAAYRALYAHALSKDATATPVLSA
jgi:uncharacterized membrane protein